MLFGRAARALARAPRMAAAGGASSLVRNSSGMRRGAFDAIESKVPSPFMSLRDVVDQLEEAGPRPLRVTTPETVVAQWDREAAAIEESLWQTDLWKVVVTPTEQPFLAPTNEVLDISHNPTTTTEDEAVVGDDAADAGLRYYAHVTYTPSLVRRRRKHGFLARLRSRHGRKILRRRMAKGRGKRLCV